MKKTGRKILSWFLTVVLCITTVQLFPLPTTKADGDMGAHVHDGITFEAWTSDNSLPSTAGSYYLTKDVTINYEWGISADINLCLNGHTITSGVSGNLNVISIGSGKHFTLFDCEGTGKITHTVRSNGTVWVSGGHFVMYGGEINDNPNNWGVHTGDGGSFTMYGGTITGMKDMSRAAVADASSNGTFNLYGGTISGNKIGVNVSNGNVNLSGNMIIKNNTDGNLYIANGKTVNIVGELTEGASIGVTMANATGTFTSGITDATTAETYKAFFTSDNNAFGVMVDTSGQLKLGNPPAAKVGDTEYATFADALSAWTAGTTLQLFTDVTTSSTITVPSGEHTLDLNGHGICMTGSDSVITVPSSATLKLYDSDTTTEHRFTVADAASNGAGLATVNDALTSGYQTFTGGYITGGKGKSVSSWREGGGIYIEGTVEMYGGTIIGNGVYGTTHGGAIVPRAATAKFIMYGGELRNNAALCGGAFRYKGGTVEIRGGKIRYNKASGDGGAIHDGVQLLENCEVSNNYAQNGPGGGVWIYSTTTTQMKVSGSTVISGNLKGSGTSNVELNNGSAMITVGTLESGSDIGVTMNNAEPGVFTSGITDATTAETYKAFFTSDNNAFEVMVDTSGQLKLGNPPAAKVGDTEYATFADALSAWTAGTTLQLFTDVTTSSTITIPSGTRTLDLNGHGIKMTGSGAVIYVPAGATLTINDSNPTVTHNYTISSPSANGAGLATVGSGDKSFTGGYVTGGNNSSGNSKGGGGIAVQGTLTMNGGTVIGNSSNGTGGGICQYGNGTMTLNGTYVIGNKSGNCCAGVDVNGGDAGNNPTAVLNDCVVQYNFAASNVGGVGARAGKITLNNCDIIGNTNGTNGYCAGMACQDCKVTLNGGNIKDNYCASSTSAYAQGLTVRNGNYQNPSFTLMGNITLSGNKLGTTAHDYIYVDNGRMINIGGELTGGPIAIKMSTPGVFTSGWNTYMSGKEHTNYFTSYDTNYIVWKNTAGELEISLPPMIMIGDARYASIAEAVNAWTDGSTLQLIDDVTTSSTITIPSGTRTLDLNGHSISASASGYSIFTVPSGADLTITDGSSGGKITGGSVSSGGGAITVDGGTLRLTGGAITGNSSTGTTQGAAAAGIYLKNSASFYMTGGEISGNTSASEGGAICTDATADTVSITGGEIKNNRAKNHGSAVWAGRTSGATFVIGGTAKIVDNVSDTNQASVNTAGSTNYQIYGDPEIHGKGASSNEKAHINIDVSGTTAQHKIKIIDKLTNATGTPKIYVSVFQSIPSGSTIVFTEGWTDKMGTENPNRYFTTEIPGLKVVRKNGEAALGNSSDYYINYDANGGTGTVDTQVFTTANGTVSANAFTLEKYYFTGWNTAADGSGTGYAEGADITVSADITLYAQWDVLEKIVTFNANGGEGTMENQIIEARVPTRLNLCAFSYYGHYFNGWNTAADGSGDKYDNIQEVTLYGDLTLYAQWEILYRTVTFDANGGEGTMATQAVPDGIATALNGNGFTNTNYLFLGWNTAADGSGDSYPDGQTVTFYGNMTLYAQWAASYRTITFNANGGKGTMKDQKVMPRVATALTENTFEREEYEFEEWNTKADGSGDSYSDKGSITLKDDITLYAQWKVVQAVEIKLDGKAADGITVSGLEELAAELIEENKDDPLLVTMTVENKSSGNAKGYDELKALAIEDSPECDLECFEITLKKTSKGKKTAIEEAKNALEIVIPYKFKGKEDVAFYRYLGGAQKMTETSSRTMVDGTYYLDRDNDCIYVYASNFTTYAISAVQCYDVSGAVEFDGDLSSVKIKLTDAKGKEYEIDCGGGEGSWQCSFTHIPKGTYTLTASWEENGKSYSVTSEVEIRDED